MDYVVAGEMENWLLIFMQSNNTHYPAPQMDKSSADENEPGICLPLLPSSLPGNDNWSLTWLLCLCFRIDSDEVKGEELPPTGMREVEIGVIVTPCRDRSSKGWATSSVRRYVPVVDACRSDSPNLIENKIDSRSVQRKKKKAKR